MANEKTELEIITDLAQVTQREVKRTYPFRSPLNSNAFPKRQETNTQPSKTIPDQSLSVRQILERYARGLPLDGQRVSIYDGENDELQGIDINTLDLSEKHDLVEANKQRIQDMQAEMQGRSDQKRLKQKQKELDNASKDTPKEGTSAAPSAAQAPQQEQPK